MKLEGRGDAFVTNLRSEKLPEGLAAQEDIKNLIEGGLGGPEVAQRLVPGVLGP